MDWHKLEIMTRRKINTVAKRDALKAYITGRGFKHLQQLFVNGGKYETQKVVEFINFL